ncbi:hypothetical protein HY448_00145 [Candidatus Pacearchaeota archaeon]|nr:hypothetical protein [Candidatus Pacearchaeota archaeon]
MAEIINIEDVRMHLERKGRIKQSGTSYGIPTLEYDPNQYGDSETPDIFAEHEQRVDAFFKYLLEKRGKGIVNLQEVRSKTLSKKYFRKIAVTQREGDKGLEGNVVEFPAKKPISEPENLKNKLY